MGEERSDALDEVAGAVADGTPVDWAREKEAAGPGVQEALEHLSIVEQIRNVHSSTPPAAGSTQDMAATVQIPPGISNWRHLRILELLGYGTWGEVYRAFDPTLQLEVALKLLKFEEPSGVAAERFLSEARRLARVRHHNVVTVHGADIHDGRYGIWTELIRGQTLEAYVKRQGPLSPREATLVGLDLCRALSAVHAAGLIHRDLKAGNVMREEGGRIVLMDFGSGADLPAGGAKQTSQHIYGTPMVMAPEQLHGEVAGPATDVYGLGVLLYWLVSRSYPIDAADFAEIVRRHERREYVPLRDRRADLPLGFVQVVERAIAPEPRNRFASAGALERALVVNMPRQQWWERPLGWMGRLRGWRGVAAAATLGGMTVVLLLHPWKRTEGETKHGLESQKQSAVTGTTAGGEAGLAHRGALTASASLRRLAAGGEEVVTAGCRVAPGDRLSISLEGSDSMYVYVLNEDRTGNVFVLFPIPGLLPKNPLSPSVKHHLPGAVGDSLVYWNVTSSGGRESIITVASREPLEQWEREIRRFPTASRGRPIAPNRVSPGTVRTLRGLGGISVEPPERTTSHRSLAEAIRALEEKSVKTGDIWIWTTELENP